MSTATSTMAEASDHSTKMKAMFQDVSKSFGEDWEVKLLDGTSNITAPPCRKILRQIGLDETRTTPFALLDHSCGPGVTGAEIQKLVRPEVLKSSSILSGDISAQMVDLTQRRAQREGWVGKCETSVIDAQKSGLPGESFSHVTLNLGFHVIPDAEAALTDSIRVLRPGGTIGFTTMHESNCGFTPDLRSAFQSVGAPYPSPYPQQTHSQGRWYDHNWVRSNLIDHGLQDVKVEVSSHLSHVKDAVSFGEVFTHIISFIINAYWDEEAKRKFDKDELKQAIVKHCEEKYASQGWDLAWTLIIASGKKPPA